MGLKRTYVWRDGEMVEVTPARYRKIHAVKDDTMDPFVSHATSEGKVFDSMSKYKEHLERHGYEITGGDHITGVTMETHRPRASREEINASVMKAIQLNKWGMAPLTEKEKEICLRENRKIEAERKRRWIK